MNTSLGLPSQVTRPPGGSTLCDSVQEVLTRRQKTARIIAPFAISHPRIGEINTTFLVSSCGADKHKAQSPGDNSTFLYISSGHPTIQHSGGHFATFQRKALGSLKFSDMTLP